MEANSPAPASQKAERTYPLLSRREVEGLIADGRLITIIEQHALKLDAWLKYHPGGEKTILHMIGRDATDEVSIYHSDETLASMRRYRIGRINGPWKNFLPPIQGGVFRPLSQQGGDEEEQEREKEQEKEQEEPVQTREDNESSSSTSSRTPSPVFDSHDNTNGAKLRTRHGGSSETAAMSASVSSASSVVDGGDTMADGMAHLDVITKQEIKLDIEKYPSLDQATQDAIVQKYRALYERVHAEGLYQCNYWSYGIELMRYALLAGLTLFFLRLRWYSLSAVFLGSLWHQLVFTAHDAGHISITHNYHVDTLIGILVADFCGGLSLGWWKINHNVHHVVTNMPEHDPDIEHMPFFAVSHRFLTSMRSTYYERVMEYDAAAQAMLQVQHYMYYVYLLFGRFNLYRLSWEFLLAGLGPRKGPAAWHRYLEVAGQIFFWYWFGYLVMYRSIDSGWARFSFFMISHFVTSPVHCQITLSHFAMSTADLGPAESFPQKMLRTTMDVDCPQWLDFIHGGLQFQAVHHLFPRVPRHNLRRTQRLVQEFCNDAGIPYALYGFVAGNQEVIGKLAEVARQAAILNKCQSVMAQGGADHHHHH